MPDKTSSKQALLTDDTPHARKAVILLLVLQGLLTLILGVLLYLAIRYEWGMILSVVFILVWVALEIVCRQIWKTIAFRLTVLENAIILQLFCRKKKIPLAEIESFGYEPIPGTAFYRFKLDCKGETVVVETQFAEQMLVILRTRTTATERET